MPSINKLCERMRFWCEDADLGYDQWQRWDIHDGGESDCSSLVYWCLYEAGFLEYKPTWGNTATLWGTLKTRGWKRLAPDGHPRKGDILLNDKDHVAVMITDRLLAQASIDENGNIAGGRAGDQTGMETNVKAYYSYPWNAYLRYEGDQSVKPPADWVRRLQAECNAQGLSNQPVDGDPGPVTLAGCCQLRNGDRGKITGLLQEYLEFLGYYCGGVDGIFGSWTESGVRSYQKDQGITSDGWVGRETWSRLLGIEA